MKSKRNILKVVAALLAVAAGVFLLATYGTALPTTPFSTIPLNGPTAVDSDGKLTAVADTESRRMLVLNDEGALTGVVDCTTVDSPVETVTDVCVSDGRVYVAGAKYVPDSDIVSKERIAVYDKGGNYLATIFEKTGAGSEQLAIRSLSNAPAGVVAAIEEPDSSASDINKITFTFVDADGSKELSSADAGLWDTHSVGFSYALGKFVTLSSRGLINDSDFEAPRTFAGHVFTSADIDDEGVLYASDDVTGSLCAIGENGDVREIVAGVGFDIVHENSGVVAVADREASTIALCDHEGTVRQTLSAVAPSIGFSIRMLFVWLSALYLAGLAIVFAARRLRRLVAEGRTESIGPAFASVAVIVVIAIAVGSLSLASNDNAMKTRSNEIGFAADYLQMSASDLSEYMTGINKRDAFRSGGEEFDAALGSLVLAIQRVAPLVQAANENRIGMYYTLYGKDDQGVFCIFDSSGERIVGTSERAAVGDNPVAQAFEGPYSPEDSEVLSGRTLRDTTLYRLVQVPSTNAKETIAVIEIGSKVHSFEASLAVDTAQRLLALLVMALVVYLTYTELRACGSTLFERRQLVQSSPGDALAMLTRPFTFAITILEGIDVIMTVLIARDLLTAAGGETASPLLALPTAMLGAGLVVGQALYGALGSRVGVRRLMVVGALVMLACAGFTAASVVIGNFWLYCAAKFVLSVPFGLMYALGYSLPRAAEHEAVRVEAAGGVRRTDTSAAALGTVLGGYAAQALGNAWVYAVVAMACLPIIVMALNLLPKGARPLEGAAESPVSHALPKFVRSRKALAIVLFIVFPATLAAGYASFLFPLFSSDLGLDKAQINNIFVLGQLIVFVCIARIEVVEARFGRWRAIASAIALIGVVFLLFSLNETIVWSVAVVALVAVLGKTAEGWKALWLRSADEAGVQAGKATSAMLVARSITQIAQPFILSALLARAEAFAIIVIGALCLLCAVAFFLGTRHTSLAKM